MALATAAIAAVTLLTAFSTVHEPKGVNPELAAYAVPPPVAPAPKPKPAPAPPDPLEAKLDALEQSTVQVPSRLTSPPIANATSLSPKDDLLARAVRDGLGHLWVPSKDGGLEQLTLDADLQEKLTRVLDRYRTPYGAVVVMDPRDGRVLAMAEHSEHGLRGLTTKAIFPAASVFKVVTASALLRKGLTPETEECFHGGKRHIRAAMLEDSRRDRRCMSMSRALAYSANAVFAKLTHKDLAADALREAAEAFHFNRSIDFPIPTDMSLAAVPDDPLGLARAGAGFGDVYLSPLHGALLASVIANRGRWQPPVLFEKNVERKVGHERVMPEEIADQIAAMMAKTVDIGTARKIFHQRGFAVRNAAGKTGSLSDRKPYRDYTWFVGFAPRDNPRVAVAAVIVNGWKWRIHGPWLAREAIRYALQTKQHFATR